MLSLVMFGFLIGLQHALEADHVAAVAVIASERSGVRRIARIGAFWGLGHTLTLAVFGGLLFAVDLSLDSSMAGALEFVVGLMLVVLGGRVALRLFIDRVHFHIHRHREIDSMARNDSDSTRSQVHLHAHSHAHEPRGASLSSGAGPHSSRPHEHRHLPLNLRRAFVVGIMHGLAGSAAIVAMTAGTSADPLAALSFILLFGLGSIVGMSVLSAAIAVPLSLTAVSLTWANRLLQGTAACFALALGGVLVFQHSVDMFRIIGGM